MDKIKQMETQSWYNARKSVSWALNLVEFVCFRKYAVFARNQRAPSRCDQIFAGSCNYMRFNSIQWSFEAMLYLPVSLCTARILKIDLGYEKEA